MEAICALCTGVALFLFGIGLMGEQAARLGERRQLQRFLVPPGRGFLVGVLSTAALQSSSAVTVLLTTMARPMAESFPVIMGANVGTTITAWLQWLQMSLPGGKVLLPPLLLGSTALYLLRGRQAPVGFFLLLTGMETMASAAAGLEGTPAFQQMLAAIAGVPAALGAGIVTTALLQSSGAAIAVLQALSAGGALPAAVAVPMLMGQNIGTCATALLASLAGNRRARAIALAHLGFNLIGTAVFLPAWIVMQKHFTEITPLGIAVFHTGFNLLTCGLFCLAGWIRRLWGGQRMLSTQP